MKVLLLNPPNVFRSGDDFYVTFPLGLAYLGSYLESHGIEVRVLDSLAGFEPPNERSGEFYRVGLRDDEIINQVRRFAPDLIGITCAYTVQFPPALEIARKLKQAIRVPIIIGGAHCSALPLEVMEYDCFDYVSVGEGEGPLLAVCAHLSTGQPLRDIKGLVRRTPEGIAVNDKVPFDNIDRIPRPAHHLFDMGKYINSDYSHNGFVMRKPYATMITSRGCPLECTFCSVHNIWGRNNRRRDVKSTVDEMQHLRDEYGVREIHFEDDQLVLNKDYFKSLCEEIAARNLDMVWTTPNGVYVNALDENALRAAKAAGCYQLALAVESGSPRVLKDLMKKSVSLDRGRAVTRAMRQLEMGVYFFFIIGMPGETEEDVLRTIEYAKEVCPDEAYFSIATPYPGTELYTTCLERGYIPKNYDVTLLKPTQPLIETEWLSRKRIAELCAFAYSEWEATKKSSRFNEAPDTALSRRGGVYTFA